MWRHSYPPPLTLSIQGPVQLPTSVDARAYIEASSAYRRPRIMVAASLLEPE